MAALNGGAVPSIKVERENDIMSGIEPHIKPDPDAPGPSPATAFEEDVYEDAGDLDFSQAKQPIWLTRIPKFLWDNWSEIDNEQEIQLGTVRVEGSLQDIKRMSLLLSSDPAHNGTVPKEYNLPITNETPVNTYVFTEKNLPGYESKLTDTPKPGVEAGAAKFPPIPARLKYQNRQKSGNPEAVDKNKRWEPYYPKAVPKQTTLAGHVRRELNCLPVENKEYRRVIEERTRQAMKPKPKTQFLDGDVQTHAGNVLEPGTIGMAGRFENFIKTTGKPRGRQPEQKATRMPQNELLDRIYACFQKYNYWSLKALKAELNQPEAWLKEVLEPIAQLVRSGSFAMTYMLNPESKFTTYANAESYDNVKNEVAPDVGYGMDGEGDTGDDNDDDDEAQMEDVMS
ncbi:MAG: hypothetical protein M1835_007329 [Candelina submexicana]|nr:MAG: hypothetical protein M1835_007329 [Candelina submexicana]